MRKLLLAFMLIFIALPVQAEESVDLDYGAFQTLPILHEGRIKPLGSFARIEMRRVSRQGELGDLTPASWLAEILFDPPSAAHRPVFAVNDHEVKVMLGLPEGKSIFTLEELQPGLEKTRPQLEALLAAPRENLTKAQLQLLQIHENTLSFTELLRSLSLLLPLDVEVPEKYAKSITGETPSYRELVKIEPRAMEDLKKLVKKKGEDPEKYSDDEKALAQFAFYLQIFRAAAQNNTALRIVPAGWDEEGLWVSPWTVEQGEGAPENTAYLEIWKRMALAYREGNLENWDKATHEALTYIEDNFGEQVSLQKLKIENFYYAAHPFQWALALYAAAFALALALNFSQKIPRKLPLLALGAGLVAHVIGIIIRVMLLSRPPVSTLYESVLFVAAVCAGVALLAATKSKNNTLPLAGSLAAAILLLIAPVLATDGETLDTLVAVLNTNFWLATHVLCITAGYGLCILSAVTAHIYMFARLDGQPQDKHSKLFQNAYLLSLAALLFTAVGTVLGGIWADQSWGRFWGWDPKENGALLIVLWLLWAQHGRVSTHLRPLPFMASLAFLNVVVALAWFGVNLLSVGLHSYGFTTGMAAGLGLFCGAEIVLIGGLWLAVRMRERAKNDFA